MRPAKLPVIKVGDDGKLQLEERKEQEGMVSAKPHWAPNQHLESKVSPRIADDATKGIPKHRLNRQPPKPR